jgi:hypothetical protein
LGARSGAQHWPCSGVGARTLWLHAAAFCFVTCRASPAGAFFPSRDSSVLSVAHEAGKGTKRSTRAARNETISSFLATISNAQANHVPRPTGAPHPASNRARGVIKGLPCVLHHCRHRVTPRLDVDRAQWLNLPARRATAHTYLQAACVLFAGGGRVQNPMTAQVTGVRGDR